MIQFTQTFSPVWRKTFSDVWDLKISTSTRPLLEHHLRVCTTKTKYTHTQRRLLGFKTQGQGAEVLRWPRNKSQESYQAPRAGQSWWSRSENSQRMNAKKRQWTENLSLLNTFGRSLVLTSGYIHRKLSKNNDYIQKENSASMHVEEATTAHFVVQIWNDSK